MSTRRSCLVVLLSFALGACSTALLVDTPYDDDPQPDAGPAPDASLPIDASIPRDASVPRDSSSPRDSSLPRPDGGPRDAGPARDAAFPRDCTRELPSPGIASLLTDDCAMRRPTVPCANQAELDRQLAVLARSCRVPTNATLGVQISGAGCPTFLFYDLASVQGSVSLCVQTVLETVRLACPSTCGVSAPGSR